MEKGTGTAFHTNKPYCHATISHAWVLGTFSCDPMEEHDFHPQPYGKGETREMKGDE